MLVVKTLRQAKRTTIQTTTTEGSDRVPVKAVKTPAPLLVRSLFLFFFFSSNRSGGRGKIHFVWGLGRQHTYTKKNVLFSSSSQKHRYYCTSCWSAKNNNNKERAAHTMTWIREKKINIGQSLFLRFILSSFFFLLLLFASVMRLFTSVE